MVLAFLRALWDNLSGLIGYKTKVVYPELSIMIRYLKKLDNSPTSKLGFDMAQTYYSRAKSSHPCGNACCIGGHAAKIMCNHSAASLSSLYHPVASSLSELCEIPYRDSHAICFPKVPNCSSISLREAISVLEHCRTTGIVDWTIQKD